MTGKKTHSTRRRYHGAGRSFVFNSRVNFPIILIQRGLKANPQEDIMLSAEVTPLQFGLTIQETHILFVSFLDSTSLAAESEKHTTGTWSLSPKVLRDRATNLHSGLAASASVDREVILTPRKTCFKSRSSRSERVPMDSQLVSIGSWNESCNRTLLTSSQYGENSSYVLGWHMIFVSKQQGEQPADDFRTGFLKH